MHSIVYIDYDERRDRNCMNMDSQKIAEIVLAAKDGDE